jgi:hypothetical protein
LGRALPTLAAGVGPMKTPMNGNGHNVHSQAIERLIYLPDGRSIALEDPTTKIARRDDNVPHVPLTQPPHREVQFAPLAAGGLVDLVRGQRGDLEFVVYRDGATSIQGSVEDGGVILMPPSGDYALLQAVRYPKCVAACETPQALLAEIREFLQHYLEIGEAESKLVAYFALSTWLSDLYTVAPYLWIVGPHSGGKTTLLRALSAICRRALLVGDITPASIYSLSNSHRPTLLLDEFESGSDRRSRDLQRLLRTGTTEGQKVFRGPKAYDVFGPKAIASRQASPDAALLSRALVVTMKPTLKELPPLDPVVLEEIADRLQPKLLAFRLQNYRRAKAPELVSVGLTPRSRDIARALALPLLGDHACELVIVELLRPHDAEAKLARRGEPEWAVATTLFSVCHRSYGTLTMGGLAVEVHQTLINACETYKLEPRKVGDIVRALGIQTQSLGNQGRGIRLTQELVKQIHEVAKGLGLTRSDILHPETTDDGYGGAPCDLCQRLGLMVDDKGNPLRCIDLTQRPKRLKVLRD